MKIEELEKIVCRSAGERFLSQWDDDGEVLVDQNREPQAFFSLHEDAPDTRRANAREAAALHNHAAALLKVASAAISLAQIKGKACDNKDHRPLRHPLCGACYMDAN